MKILYVFLLYVIVFIPNVIAKTKYSKYDSIPFKTHELSVNYGFASFEQLVVVFGNTINPLNLFLYPLQPNQERKYKLIAPASLTYKYYLKPKVAFTAKAYYSFLKYNVHNTDSGEYVNDFTDKYHFFGLIVGTEYHYLNKKNVQLYLGADFGFSLIQQTQYDYNNSVSKKYKIDGFFAFQTTLFGIRFGNKFGGFAEAGFGSLGILNLGLSYKF
ncbi:MAG: hypothetical protein KA322_00060 [Chitinophagales bacterium]|nr:hypothetical protein [Chitinophagales bacterium]